MAGGASEVSFKPASFRRWTWLIFAAIVLTRLAYTGWQGPKIAADSAGYIANARLFVAQPGTWYVYVDRGVNQAPLYSAFLGLFFFLFPGQAIAAYVAAQALLSGFIGLGVAWLARQGWGERAGLLAGVAVLVCPDFFFWSPYVLTDVPFAALVVLLGCQLVRTCHRRWQLANGLLLALLLLLLLLLRREAVLLLLAAPLALLWAMRGRWRAAAAALIGFALPFALLAGLALLPNVTPRVPRTLGIDPSHVETAALIPVWAGTHWTPAGRGTVGVDVQSPADLGAKTDPELAAMLRQRILAFVTSQPATFAQLAVLKAAYLWAPALPGWSRGHVATWALLFGALYVLAAVGLFSKPAERGPRELAIAQLVTFTLTCMLTFTDFDQRYRVPASIGMVVLAGVGADALARRFLRQDALAVSALERNLPANTAATPTGTRMVSTSQRLP